MKCKVCGKNLFVELDFRTLLKINYSVHESCKKYINSELKMEVIPIQNNTIKWIYFHEKKEDLNYDYLEMFLLGKGLDYCIKNSEWSIVNWMTSEEYFNLDYITQYLYLKMGDQSYVFLNMFHTM